MTKRTTINLIMVASAALLSACTADTGADSPYSCDIDADCDAGLVCASGSCQTPPANTQFASLVVENSTPKPIWVINLSPCSSASWGSNVLGINVIPVDDPSANVLQPGGTASSDKIFPECYDLRAEAPDGGYWQNLGNYFTAGQTTKWELLP